MTSGNSEALLKQGYQARRENRLAEAKAHFAEAAELSREADERAMLARAITGLGQIESDLHETSAALAHYEDAVAIYRTLSDPLALAHAVRHVGDILRRQGQSDLAAPCYIEALDLYRSHEQTLPLDLANAIRGYALLKGDAGDREEARKLWQEARDLYAAVQIPEGVAESERQIARLTS
jgi:tetratricopeptide (TPR) repeat protein